MFKLKYFTFVLALLGGLAFANFTLAASVAESNGQVYLQGSGQLLDGSFVSSNDSLNAVVFDTQALLPLQKIFLNNGSFPSANLTCSKVFYYERTDGRIVNSATIFPGNNLVRDFSGGNFKLTNCGNNPPGGVNFQNSLTHEGGLVKLSVFNRTLTLTNGSSVNSDFTNINAVIFDGRSFLRRAPLFNGNTSFNASEAPCGSRWYYEVPFSSQVVNSALIAPGSGVRRDSSQNNFELVNCSNTGGGGATSNQGSVFYAGYVNQVQLTPLNNRVTLVNGTSLDVTPSALEAVIFTPNSTQPLAIWPLGTNYTFNRVVLPFGSVWFYRLRYGGTVVNSATIEPLSCITRDHSGGNFRFNC